MRRFAQPRREVVSPRSGGRDGNLHLPPLSCFWHPVRTEHLNVGRGLV